MSQYDDNPEDVGYRKPPVKTRFKKGTSGNPRGRPKGSQNVGDIIERILTRKVAVNINGQRVYMLTSEALVAQQAAKAMQGDTNAAKFMMVLIQAADKRRAEAAGKEPTVIILQGADRYA
jgi:hypothetical protein